MIYFASKPDVVFTLILHEALEEALDDIKGVVELKDNVGWEWSYPCSFRCLNPEIAAKVAKQLLAISKEPDPYRITDYHYQMLIWKDDIDEMRTASMSAEK